MTIPLPSWKRDGAAVNDNESGPSRWVPKDIDHATELLRALASRLQRTRDALGRIVNAHAGTCTPEEVTERLRGIANRALEDDTEADFNMVAELDRGHSSFCRAGDGPTDELELSSFVVDEELLVRDRLRALWRLESVNEHGDRFQLRLVEEPPPIGAIELSTRIADYELPDGDGG